MQQKKLMLLGGLRYLIPVIEAAHKLGYYVITCDYLPDNIAHKYSDEYCNVSILDKEAVLAAAKERHIDGIMSFAVDPGVVTAAYVQEKMGLPAFGPYESVCILQNKDLFRKFLADNGFYVPKAKSFTSVQEALSGLAGLEWPLIVKPTDSAGSKGVTKVEKNEDLERAINHAIECSHSNRVIIEEFIEQEGCSSDSDCFSVNGKLMFVSFSAQRFDENAANPYTPAAFSWPSTMTVEQETYLSSELQRLISLLKMNTTVYNVETRIGKNGKPYIMEVSPRGGGNRLSEMIRLATGIDLITNAVKAAVGDSAFDFEYKESQYLWAEIILHSSQSGIFQFLKIREDVYNSVVFQKDLWVEKGDSISKFLGANDSIGTIVLKMKKTDFEYLDYLLENQNEWLNIMIS